MVVLVADLCETTVVGLSNCTGINMSTIIRERVTAVHQLA